MPCFEGTPELVLQLASFLLGQSTLLVQMYWLWCLSCFTASMGTYTTVHCAIQTNFKLLPVNTKMFLLTGKGITS